MNVEQQERHKEESRRCDVFEAAQEERFRLVHEHMPAQDNNLTTFLCMLQSSSIKFARTWDSTMIHYENENHRHYQQFYREMCDFFDVEYENDGVAWYRGRIPETRGNRDHRN